MLADETRQGGSKTDAEIAEQVAISRATVQRVRRRFVEEGLEAALTEKLRSGAPPKLSGRQRAEITALACSEPPEGRPRWSLRLLADKLVELGMVDRISHVSVQQVLKKRTSASPQTTMVPWSVNHAVPVADGRHFGLVRASL